MQHTPRATARQDARRMRRRQGVVSARLHGCPVPDLSSERSSCRFPAGQRVHDSNCGPHPGMEPPMPIPLTSGRLSSRVRSGARPENDCRQGAASSGAQGPRSNDCGTRSRPTDRGGTPSESLAMPRRSTRPGRGACVASLLQSAWEGFGKGDRPRRKFNSHQVKSFPVDPPLGERRP